MLSAWDVFIFSFWSVLISVFSHPLIPFIIITLLLLLSLLSLVITVIIISTELMALCDGYLSWGWVWWVGLVARLRVGQAFGGALASWV